MERISLRLSPRDAADENRRCEHAAKMLGIASQRIKRIDIVKRSIDARQRRVMVNLTLDVHIDDVDNRDSIIAPPICYPNVRNAPQAIIIGAGPAGLFAALELIERGIRPIVLERGKDVDSRRIDMALISRTQSVNPESNYCFGEGGAGAFSDGKLYTRSIKRGPVNKVLQIFYHHGASRDILVDAHPHIGTDRLPEVIKAIRNTIENADGEVRFSSKVTDLIITDNTVTGVRLANGSCEYGPVILATGHSARDIYAILNQHGVAMNPKGIAVGVRLEHPQEVIDQIQYHSPEGRGRWLPAAEYSMLTRVNDRAVYSFCMCPGGVIIPAASGPEQLVVNGMSPSSRSGKWANSGMVVELLPEDVPGDDPLRMLHYQQSIEQQFYEAAAGTQQAPAQRMTDFVNGRLSANLPRSSYAPGVISKRVDQLLPPEIATRLQEGFRIFGRKAHGFLCDDALVVGDETRTSAPVQIPRDQTKLHHIDFPGLYPCGEGAGHAGGIVSAAIDGIRCANALADAQA